MNGYERITKMYLNSTKDNALKRITKFLMTKQGMNEYYSNEEKTLDEMMSYISKEARQKAVNNVAVLDDDEVYQLANMYFTHSNADLGLIKTSTPKVESKKEESKENDNQLSLDLSNVC